MESKVKVTIGLCVKNSELTIGKAIDGIISQDFPHQLMELIIVDGYSRDKTLQVIEEKLAKSDIKSRLFRENLGLGMARQIVVDHAKGEYIIWVDGDIILPKSYVRKQVEFMDKNSKAGIAEGTYGECFGQSLVSLLENIVPLIRSKDLKGVNLKAEPLAATEGAIWRVQAIKEAGGFDIAIKGAAEDTDVAYRIKTSGWDLYVTKETFFEVCRETWKSLWDQYFWYGYGAHYIHHKNSRMLCLCKMLPIIGFLVGVLYSVRAYKLIHRKIVFLLPAHYTFKRTAWWFGYVKSHVDGYGH